MKRKEYFNIIIKVNSTQNKINFSNYTGFIFPQKIMNLIYKLDKDFINISKPQTFIFIDNNIYYINGQNIFLGNYQNNASFEPKSIFICKNFEIKLEEKNIINTINYCIKKNKIFPPICVIIKSEKNGYQIMPYIQSNKKNNQSAAPQRNHLKNKSISNNNDNKNNEMEKIDMKTKNVLNKYFEFN